MPLQARHLLSTLLVLDGLFFALHSSGQFFHLSLGRLFVISSDWSLPEMFQYLKELSIVTMLLFAFAGHQKNLYLAWMTFFSYLLLDDALMIREWLGNVIAQKLTFQLPLQLRSNDIGEVIALALFAVVLLPPLVLTHASSSQPNRRLSWLLAPWLALLLLCGFVFDMAHSIFMEEPKLELLFGFLEDGGEMVVMSSMVWVVYRWFVELPKIFKGKLKAVSTHG